MKKKAEQTDPSPDRGESDEEAPQSGQLSEYSQMAVMKIPFTMAHAVQYDTALAGSMMIQPDVNVNIATIK